MGVGVGWGRLVVLCSAAHRIEGVGCVIGAPGLEDGDDSLL